MKKNKVTLSISLSPETRDKLFQYADAQCISASAVIQMTLNKVFKEKNAS